MAEGTLCVSEIPGQSWVVVRVPVKNVEEEYRDEVTGVTLAPQDGRQQRQAGDCDRKSKWNTNSHIYGNITSISRKLTIPDAEYTLITTNMAAGNDGGGVLLDMDGKMIGIILDHEEEKSCVIRAVSVAQLGTVWEKLNRRTHLLCRTDRDERFLRCSLSRDIPGGFILTG